MEIIGIGNKLDNNIIKTAIKIMLFREPNLGISDKSWVNELIKYMYEDGKDFIKKLITELPPESTTIGGPKHGITIDLTQLMDVVSIVRSDIRYSTLELNPKYINPVLFIVGIGLLFNGYDINKDYTKEEITRVVIDWYSRITYDSHHFGKLTETIQ